MAREQGLDLVMVSPSAQPPVCKIIDYGKHKYEQEKLQKDHKRKQQEVKGIKISPRIAEHDIQFLTRNAHRFLEEGHKVKVTCVFKAREVTHPELGAKKLAHFAEIVSELATVERPPRLDGRQMVMTLLPKAPTSKAKPAKAVVKSDKPKAEPAEAAKAESVEDEKEMAKAETEEKQQDAETQDE